MLRIELARRLRTVGLTWSPRPGDRFVVPDRDMDDDVFIVSDFTVEVQDLPSGPVLRFNGTTEWALDSVSADDVLWLPREGQLRDQLGPTFQRLEVRAGRWVVVVTRADAEHCYEDDDVECAYALAVLGDGRSR